MRFHAFVLLFVVSLVIEIQSYKILSISPTMSRSHHLIACSLMKGLAEKGHDVTMIAPFPLDAPHRNIREIQVSKVLTEGRGKKRHF